MQEEPPLVSGLDLRTNDRVGTPFAELVHTLIVPFRSFFSAHFFSKANSMSDLIDRNTLDS